MGNKMKMRWMISSIFQNISNDVNSEVKRIPFELTEWAIHIIISNQFFGIFLLYCG